MELQVFRSLVTSNEQLKHLRHTKMGRKILRRLQSTLAKNDIKRKYFNYDWE